MSAVLCDDQAPADRHPVDAHVTAVRIATAWLVERRSRLLEKDWLTADQVADLRFMYESDVESLLELHGSSGR